MLLRTLGVNSSELTQEVTSLVVGHEHWFASRMQPGMLVTVIGRRSDTEPAVLRLPGTDAKALLLPADCTRQGLDSTWVEFCSGIGGFTEMLHAQQQQVIAAFDNDHDASMTFRRAWGSEVAMFQLDVTDLRFAPYFAIAGRRCAGSPCQPFSAAGVKRGWSDSRAAVTATVVLLARVLPAEITCVENVAALLQKAAHRQGLEKLLHECQLRMAARVYRTAAFLPQQRNRALLVLAPPGITLPVLPPEPQPGHMRPLQAWGLPMALPQNLLQQLRVPDALARTYQASSHMPSERYQRVLQSTAQLETIMRSYANAHRFAAPWYGQYWLKQGVPSWLHPSELLIAQGFGPRILQLAWTECGQQPGAVWRWWQLAGNAAPPPLLTYVMATLCGNPQPTAEHLAERHQELTQQWIQSTNHTHNAQQPLPVQQHAHVAAQQQGHGNTATLSLHTHNVNILDRQTIQSNHHAQQPQEPDRNDTYSERAQMLTNRSTTMPLRRRFLNTTTDTTPHQVHAQLLSKRMQHKPSTTATAAQAATKPATPWMTMRSHIWHKVFFIISIVYIMVKGDNDQKVSYFCMNGSYERAGRTRPSETAWT